MKKPQISIRVFFCYKIKHEILIVELNLIGVTLSMRAYKVIKKEIRIEFTSQCAYLILKF